MKSKFEDFNANEETMVVVPVMKDVEQMIPIKKLSRSEKKALNVLMNPAVFEMLEQFCDESGMSKTVAVERILSRFLGEYFRKSEEERQII